MLQRLKELNFIQTCLYSIEKPKKSKSIKKINLTDRVGDGMSSPNLPSGDSQWRKLVNSGDTEN